MRASRARGHGRPDDPPQVRYFTYEVHVSKQFLITTTLASALYLCVIRFLSASFEECFTLADAIGTDRAFTPDESQIFRLLSLHTKSPMRYSPDAAACLCKIALTVDDANNKKLLQYSC